jgi:hypothetical protein
MRIVVLLIVAGGFVACQNNSGHATAEQAKVDTLLKEVIKGHDVGMAKMKALRTAIAGTQAKLDSLNALPASKVDAAYQQALIDLQEDLNYAEYGMNQWMNEFKLDSAEDNSELRLQYLESEKEKVFKVRDNILNGLARADSLLKK